jgi:DNA-binding XRE family transcriptional regulator
MLSAGRAPLERRADAGPSLLLPRVPARLGIEIRRARVEQGLTQAEFARRMGVRPPYVASLEAGKRNVTLGQLANDTEDIAFESRAHQWGAGSAPLGRRPV